MQTLMMSDDPSIVPPLSRAELVYQCNGTAPPCKLHWYPGKLCYKLLDANFSDAPLIPGTAILPAATVCLHIIGHLENMHD